MNCTITASLAGAAAIAALATTVAFAQQSKDGGKTTAPQNKTAPKQEMQLPPGMTEADMQACIAAATPGPMQLRLTEEAGLWNGKNTMWMAPDAPPVTSESTLTITPFLDGRFVKCEMAGEIPDMGPINGFGIYGFDNVSQKFQGTWIDSCSTGMMVGTGALSDDGKTMTWTYTFNCPMAKKAMTMRQIDRRTGTDTKTMEMWTTDPKSGKDYKMLEVAMTRKQGATKVGTAR